MDTCIKYTHEQLYARAWYVAQVFTLTNTCVRQLTSTTGVLKGDLFRVPLSTLQHSKHEGGWNLINFLAKCRMLLITRINKQLCNAESLTTQWMKKWHLTDNRYNPPNTTQLPEKFDYLITYYREGAYITPQQANESMYTYRKRLYNTELYYIQPPHVGPPPPRIFNP
jgi:hypothetical protein